MRTDLRSGRRYVGRLVLLYGLLCIVSFAIPGCTFGYLALTEPKGLCTAIAGVMAIAVVSPFVFGGWLLHVAALGFFSWSRHGTAGLGRGPDIAVGVAAAAVLALGAVRIGMMLMDEPMPSPEEQLFALDLGAVLLPSLLGAVAGWRTGTWASATVPQRTPA